MVWVLSDIRPFTLIQNVIKQPCVKWCAQRYSNENRFELKSNTSAKSLQIVFFIQIEEMGVGFVELKNGIFLN